MEVSCNEDAPDSSYVFFNHQQPFYYWILWLVVVYTASKICLSNLVLKAMVG